jgi:membrane protein DedA with SNARE-associated domain/membrane-associated phospholipid phosphatase
MEHIQPYLDYFTANPEWAIAIVFLIAFGEALLIIGLFVPSTAVLVGAGMLVGTGHLAFWPVLIATCAGAILGDQLSYWAGRMFGDRLKTMWPLNRYPALVAKGEDFVRSHGGKSIAIGRFVPGVKAVVPGIVGMLRMSQPFFLFVNVTSGIFWGVAHVFPGILLGQGLAFAGELSGRLAILLLILIVLLGALGWVTRLLAAGVLSPALRRAQMALSRLAKSRGTRPFARLSRVLSPDHPKATRLLTLGILKVLGLAIITFLIVRVLNLDVASNLDQSVHTLLTELRNAPADALMIVISILGDPKVMALVCAAMALWLVWFKAWRAALAVIAAVALQQLLTTLLKITIARPRPMDLVPGMADNIYSFPSGHAAAATLTFGLLAIVAGHSMGRWSKAVVVSLACMLIFLIGFSRIYLGMHWMSDVLGGIALSAIIVAAFGFVLEAYPARRIRPLGLIGFCMIAWMAVGSQFVDRGFPKAQQTLMGVERITQYSQEEWSTSQWRKVPTQRVDLAGSARDDFLFQWIGPLEILQQELARAGMKIEPPWRWSSALPYADPNAPFSQQPPRPLLHEGLLAKLTAVLPDKNAANGSEQRLIIRAYKTQDAVLIGQSAEPVYLVNLLREVNDPRMSLFTLPRSVNADDAALTAALLQQLATNPRIQTLAQNPEAHGTRAVFALQAP